MKHVYELTRCLPSQQPMTRAAHNTNGCSDGRWWPVSYRAMCIKLRFRASEAQWVLAVEDGGQLNVIQ